MRLDALMARGIWRVAPQGRCLARATRDRALPAAAGSLTTGAVPEWDEDGVADLGPVVGGGVAGGHLTPTAC